ncbi:MAG: hypothetical protein EPO68_01860 [Planctomycetota bacterium]|nr:MAG: hypothetical protein EPO68_01860 [Planctomycetota bacterium]
MRPSIRTLAVCGVALLALWGALLLTDRRSQAGGEPRGSRESALAPRAFDAAAWRAVDPMLTALRAQMLDDLAQRHLAMGADRALVHELLGPPSSTRTPSSPSAGNVQVERWRVAPPGGVPPKRHSLLELRFRDERLVGRSSLGEPLNSSDFPTDAR